jgi:hypothetical protein
LAGGNHLDDGHGGGGNLVPDLLTTNYTNMEKRIEIRVTITDLSEKPNHHDLVVALDEEIQDAVARALCNKSEDQADFTVHVPEF